MKVIELLKLFEEHYYVNISIIKSVCYTSDFKEEDEVIATWLYEDYNHWYYGQLDYFSDLDINELLPYFNSKVKSFYVVSQGLYPNLYITIE